jgi:hypothetical protein
MRDKIIEHEGKVWPHRFSRIYKSVIVQRDGILWRVVKDGNREVQRHYIGCIKEGK